MTTRHCSGRPQGDGVCATCAWYSALGDAAPLGVLGADPYRLFKAPEPEINLQAIVRRLALIERAVGLGRLSKIRR